MSLVLGEKACINCNKYNFHLSEVQGAEVNSSKRGEFCIPVNCKVCNALMAFVYYDRERKRQSKFSWAIAYFHTTNDEPCYDKDCKKCGGNTTESWWVDE